MNYDLIVIGGGPAGYLGAERAGQAGLKTLLIEKRTVGGVCLNEACIPAKTLLHSAKICDYANYGGKYGVKCEGASIDQKKVIERKNKVVNTLVSGVKMKLKMHKVHVVEGVAAIDGKTNKGFVVKVNGEAYIGQRLLIATGSKPFIPPISGVKKGLETGLVMTNREVLDLLEIPKHLVVIGGGVIGLEMASYYRSVGSKVTVIEMLDKIAGPTDKDISKILLKNYEKKGVTFHLGAKVIEMSDASVTYEKEGKKTTIDCDKVLLSIGRRPVTENIGLESIGVQMNKGAIAVDECGRTNVLNVYAAGDVNGKSMLAHTAYREAEVCVNTMLNKKDRMRYNAIPSVIYTNPEVSSVGMTQQMAKGIDVEVTTLKMNYSGRYVAENEGGDGICKLVIDKRYRRLLGVHMIGNPSSEVIYGASMMIEMEMKIDDIKELVFPHPTVSEIIREGIFNF